MVTPDLAATADVYVSCQSPQASVSVGTTRKTQSILYVMEPVCGQSGVRFQRNLEYDRRRQRRYHRSVKVGVIHVQGSPRPFVKGVQGLGRK